MQIKKKNICNKSNGRDEYITKKREKKKKAK